MKTFYLTQNCDVVCFTAAENSAAYQNCGCGSGEEPAGSIDSGTSLALFVGIVIGIYSIFKHKKSKL